MLFNRCGVARGKTVVPARQGRRRHLWLILSQSPSQTQFYRQFCRRIPLKENTREIRYGIIFQ